MKSRKFIAMFLTVMLLVGMFPTSVFANPVSVPTEMTKVSDEEATLAPGITENKVVALDKNGNRVEMFIATIDTSVETVEVYANYKDNQNDKFGMSTVREQAAAAVAKHKGENFTPIVAINASYYNTVNGKPTGAFVMEGNDVTNEAEGNNYSFFAILKDGTYMIGAKGEYSKYKGQIKEAIGGQYHIVKNGENTQDANDPVKYPRQTLGLTADGKLILMTADGSNAPKSIGLTMWEQAEVMRSLGCVEAIHLDGGGSATYTSKQVGSDSLQIVNTPSDGAERNVSNSLMVVSTAAPDGTFDHANLAVDNAYVTPNSIVRVTATGSDSTGAITEIPEDISWKLEDSKMGIVVDGVFKSNGTEGDAVVQMMYNGKIVGKTTIHVVTPTAIRLNSSIINVPYGKSIKLNVKATVNDGVNEVAYNEGEIKLSLSNEKIGTLSGFNFTANDGTSGLSQAIITASYLNGKVTGEANITLGRGSEIIEDFEDGEFSYTFSPNYNKGETGSVELVTTETGMVRSGNYAMAVNVDFSGYLANGYTGRGGILIKNWNLPNVENAVAIGFWMYIPEDMECVWSQFRTFEANTNSTVGRASPSFLEKGYTASIERPGWYYISADLSDLSYKNVEINQWQLYVEDYIDNVKYNYIADDHKNQAGKFTFYIDDVTIDYSEAVDDRENPEFGDIKLIYGTNEPVVMNGQTINDNEVVISTKATDFEASNAVGLDIESAKAYIDGVEITDKMTCTANGTMSLTKMKLSEGTHTFKFEICDNNGNTSSIERYVVVDAEESIPAISIEPNETKNIQKDKLLAGSMYWLDVKASDITNISEVSTVINLNGLHDWEADHMIVADGFEVTEYSIDKATNDLTIKIKKNEKAISSDDCILVSIPIKTWYKDNKSNSWWKRSVVVSTNYGFTKFVDGSTDSFSMSPIDVDTEVDKSGELSNIAGIVLKPWHQHTAGAAKSEAATCLEDGYKNRISCTVCNGIIDWGTKDGDATGHNYTVVDGTLKCHCGKLFNGIYSDGKNYVDGVVLEGWIEDSYYENGTLLTGVKLVDGFYYDFGNEGVCTGKVKYTGLFYDETVKAWRYSKLGELVGGWQYIDDAWHYFDETTMVAVTGDYYYASRGITYHFDEKGMTEGVWQTTKQGTKFWYGEWYYTARNEYQRCFVEIDGKTYNFDKNGYLTTGIHALYDDWAYLTRGEMKVWEFDTNGVLQKQIITPGLIDNKNGGMYLIEEDGYVHGGNAGLIKYNDCIYFVCHSGKLKQNGTQYINNANSNDLLKAGTYYFGNDCKLFTGVKENADGHLYYYENGVICSGIYTNELIEVNGEIYFVKWSGKVATEEARYINAANGHGLLKSGTYYFGEDGKLLTGVAKGDDGNLYYYKDGVLGSATYNSELISLDGEIYLVKWSGKVAACENRGITKEKSNGLLPAGVYYFDENGRLFTGVKSEADGYLYYYENGKLGRELYNSELVEVNGDIYLVKWSGKVAVNENRGITREKSNGLLSPGNYYFGEEGKLFTGIKAGDDGALYYYKNDKICVGMYNSELVEIDGNIYLVKWSGKIATNESRKITSENSNGLLNIGTYYFGADGRLFTGVKANADGVLYFYKNDRLGIEIYNSELVEVDGDIYLVKWSGKVAVNETRRITIANSNGLVEPGEYTFGADGKLVK